MLERVMRSGFAIALLLVTLAGRGAADPVLGTWLTEPDKKGQVAHILVSECGAALCGKIVKTFNSAGKAIAHPNIGKRVFWDMIPSGKNRYAGRAFVPALDRTYRGQMRLAGNSLRVSGCAGPVCMSQNWTRLQ